MLVRMRRVEIIAPRRSAARLLRAIHRAGVLHLAPFEPPPGAGPTLFSAGAGSLDRPAAPVTPYDAALAQVTELAGLLVLPPAPRQLVRRLWELDDGELLAEVAALEPVRARAAELASERLRLRGEASRLAGYRRLIEALRGAVGRLPSIPGYGSTGIVVNARYRAVVALIRDELESLTGGRCEVIAADLDPDRVAAILLYPVRLAGEVRALLGGRDLEEVTLPESMAGVPFDELGPRLAAEEVAIRQRLAHTETALEQLAVDHGALVAALSLVLADRVAEARVLAAAGWSEHLVAISGWLPERRIAGLREALAREVGPEVLVVERPADEPDRSAPVALENRPLVRAFEPLSSFVILPRYGTLDPTPVVALAFPVFVGLMVGDAGYGLLLLLALLGARRRWRTSSAMRFLWPVGALAAISTIFFGILFGEWFGDAGQRLVGLRPLWFDRREGALPLLVLAVSIGLAQVALGLVLGIVNATLLRHRREAIARGALLVSLAAIGLTIAFATGQVPAPVGQVAVVVLIGAIVILAATLGIAGPLEVMGAVGNVLSYARLMAIGLASVMLALVANRLGALVENVLFGVLIAALFHTLNFVLGFFDSSVQGLRLQYVEFFSKFVEPGGVRYEPFVSVLGEGGREPGLAATGGA
ncbi:MAG: V-type ATP synthase subunit I [Chloroflexota bacterium]